LRDQYEQTGLFGDEQLIVLLGLEKAPKLLAQARLAAQKPPLQTRLVMVFAQDKVPANLQKALPEPTHQVVCLTPGLRDMPAFLKDLARSYQVPLDDAITSMLLDSLGQDLFKIDNELRNLALLFADRDQPASAAEVQDALGFMRDDHAFRLDEYLLAGQRAKALNLIDDLIRRGESPLAILGILAHHCRKALDIHGQGGQAPAAMRMPRFVVQKFVQALQRRGSEPYRQALRSCQEADMILKTSQLPEQIALTPIVLRLTMSSEPTKRRYEPVSRSPG
jgi:DNA polymerase III delta subunit